jgi:hypothetical protein
MRVPRALGLVVPIVVLVGCADTAPRADRDRPVTDSPPEHRDAAVIRRWSNTLRSGDVGAAARLFAVPATVANGGAPQRLTTRAAIRVFNESLPCGARLLRTRHKDGYTVATFRLTERQGSDCGTAVGAIAATAFIVHRGRIREWLRLPDPAASPPAGTGTS